MLLGKLTASSKGQGGTAAPPGSWWEGANPPACSQHTIPVLHLAPSSLLLTPLTHHSTST